MDLAALVRAVEVLMAPLEWGGEDAWLAESLRRVREVRGSPARDLAADARGELETLLRLPGDEPGWLRAALDAPGSGPGRPLPAGIEGVDDLPTVATLRCALAAGLATLRRLDAWRDTLGRAFGEVDTGMAVYAEDGGREIARNARLDELLDDEPERERLAELMARHARLAVGSGEAARDADRELELTGGIYRLVASRVAAGTLLPGAAVLVLLERLGAALPTTQELRVSFGLRGREPQVALLAAEGLSNAAIAERLRLSSHTVRHYLERVLDRLGLHSRKALALRLLSGAGERPQPPERRLP